MHDLRYFLPVFMCFVLGTVYLWDRTRRRHITRMEIYTPYASYRVYLVQRICRYFNLLLVLATLVVGLYTFTPRYYRFIAFPIDSLDDPIINTTGLYILKAGFIWLIVVQMVSDRMLVDRIIQSRIFNHQDHHSRFERWYLYSKRMLSAGIAITLIGLFVTISSAATVLLVLVSLFIYSAQLHYTDQK